MQSKNDIYHPNQPLTLKTPLGNPLVVQVQDLALTEVNSVITDCCLTCRVTLELYNQIESKGLFNLSADARSLSEYSFTDAQEIEIVTRLRSDLLPNWASQVNSAETAAQSLWQLSLNRHLSDSPMLFTENWFALHVKQSVDLPPDLDGELKAGYSNTWNDVDVVNEANSINPLTEAIVNFLTEVEWPFQREISPLEDGVSIYRLMFRGESGHWNCFLCLRESEKQCVFYSVYPGLVPEGQRMAVAEFLTRANFGMVIGNFEMSIDSGEVRFKTSCEIENDLLSTEMLQKLIGANVSTMDQYLLGIHQVREAEVEPKVAISTLDT